MTGTQMRWEGVLDKTFKIRQEKATLSSMGMIWPVSDSMVSWLSTTWTYACYLAYLLKTQFSWPHS